MDILTLALLFIKGIVAEKTWMHLATGCVHSIKKYCCVLDSDLFSAMFRLIFAQKEDQMRKFGFFHFIFCGRGTASTAFCYCNIKPANMFACNQVHFIVWKSDSVSSLIQMNIIPYVVYMAIRQTLLDLEPCLYFGTAVL